MNQKRALLALLTVCIAVRTANSLARREMPPPARFIAIGVIYLVLSVVSDFGKSAARFALAFASLVTLGVLVKDRKTLGIFLGNVSDPDQANTTGTGALGSTVSGAVSKVGKIVTHVSGETGTAVVRVPRGDAPASKVGRHKSKGDTVPPNRSTSTPAPVKATHTRRPRAANRNTQPQPHPTPSPLPPP